MKQAFAVVYESHDDGIWRVQVVTFGPTPDVPPTIDVIASFHGSNAKVLAEEYAAFKNKKVQHR